jgi:Fe-S-cluster-containing dehydrogenase component
MLFSEGKGQRTGGIPLTGFHGIVADLDLCVGCFACEVACKEENHVAMGTHRLRVIAIGPEDCDGRLRADFVPMMTDECTFCNHRLNQNLGPRCVDNCPTDALLFCQNPKELLSLLHSGRRLQICKLMGEFVAFG